MKTERKLAAILFADIVGYTSLMQNDEEEGMMKLTHYQKALKELGGNHSGEIVKSYGDGSLMLFNSSTDAVTCAIEIQKKLNLDPRVPVRIGIHIGEILKSEDDYFGDGINIASRLESMGVAGSILISNIVNGQVRNKGKILTESLGEFQLKNVDEPVAVYAISNSGITVPMGHQIRGKAQRSKKRNTSPIAKDVPKKVPVKKAAPKKRTPHRKTRSASTYESAQREIRGSEKKQKSYEKKKKSFQVTSMVFLMVSGIMTFISLVEGDEWAFFPVMILFFVWLITYTSSFGFPTSLSDIKEKFTKSSAALEESTSLSRRTRGRARTSYQKKEVQPEEEVSETLDLDELERKELELRELDKLPNNWEDGDLV